MRWKARVFVKKPTLARGCCVYACGTVLPLRCAAPSKRRKRDKRHTPAARQESNSRHATKQVERQANLLAKGLESSKNNPFVHSAQCYRFEGKQDPISPTQTRTQGDLPRGCSQQRNAEGAPSMLASINNRRRRAATQTNPKQETLPQPRKPTRSRAASPAPQAPRRA
jgi:hypothetical protein